MLLGVSYPYFMLNFLFSTILFINTGKLIIILLVAPMIHALGYLICLKEPRAIEMLMVKGGKTMRCKQKNKVFHGFTNSYDVY